MTHRNSPSSPIPLPQVGIKDKLLQQQHTQHQANIAERDQLRVELGRWGVGCARAGIQG